MYNAQVAQRNAQAVEEEKANVQDAAAIERRRLGERIRAERGELVAKYAHMGLDTQFGSPKDLVGDVERKYDIDRSILGRNEITELKRLDQQQADYRSSATLSKMGAKSAHKAGQIGAVGSLLQGAATVSSRWIQPSQQDPFKAYQGPRATMLPVGS
jgi:ribosomal protein S6